jgi:hypothetical protein
MKKREREAAAAALGARGGKARWRNLSKQALSAIGKKAAAARWKGHKKRLQNA